MLRMSLIPLTILTFVSNYGIIKSIKQSCYPTGAWSYYHKSLKYALKQ